MLNCGIFSTFPVAIHFCVDSDSALSASYNLFLVVNTPQRQGPPLSLPSLHKPYSGPR